MEIFLQLLKVAAYSIGGIFLVYIAARVASLAIIRSIQESFKLKGGSNGSQERQEVQ